MKSTRILLVLILIFGCNSRESGNNKTELTTADQVINSQLIHEFSSSNRYIDSLIKFRGFKAVEKITINEGVDTINILLKQIPEWPDAGDFIKIQIEDLTGKILFEKINVDGWVRFNNNYSLPDIVTKNNLIDSEKALIVDNASGKQLLIFGWVYASQPGLMTVIDLFPVPQVIFNRNFDLYNITVKNNYLNFVGDTNLNDVSILNTKTMMFE